MPAAVFVIQARIGKLRYCFRLTRRLVFPRRVAIAHQLIRQRNVQPMRAASVGMKRDAVRIAQLVQPEFRPLELIPVKVFENVNRAFVIVRAVVQISHEDAIVRAFRHKPHATHALRRNGEVVTIGQVQYIAFAIGEREAMRFEVCVLCKGRKGKSSSEEKQIKSHVVQSSKTRSGTC